MLIGAMDKAEGAARAALDLLLPPHCPVTGEPSPGHGLLSPAGWAALHFIEAPFCVCCGVPFSADYGDAVECPSCIARPPAYDRARAAVSWNDAAGGLVSGFKFADRMDYARMFASWMVRAGRDIIAPQSVIAPVPLHWRRLAARRFNQSAVLAGEISRLTGAPLAMRALNRTRATPPQRDQRSSDARRRNVAGAFSVSEKMRPRVEGRHVILIDDVLTTGATLSAAARALKAGGASQVDALVLARVVKGGGGAI